MVEAGSGGEDAYDCVRLGWMSGGIMGLGGQFEGASVGEVD